MDGVPVFSITHSGRGRMILRREDGEDFVYARKGGEVKLPGSLRFARRPSRKLFARARGRAILRPT